MVVSKNNHQMWYYWMGEPVVEGKADTVAAYIKELEQYLIPI
jgi:hypothetical protein